MNTDTDWEGVRLHAPNRGWNKNCRRGRCFTNNQEKQCMAYPHKHLAMLRVTLPLY